MFQCLYGAYCEAWSFGFVACHPGLGAGKVATLVEAARIYVLFVGSPVCTHKGMAVANTGIFSHAVENPARALIGEHAA
jgi:hypothetical protein